MALIAKLPKDIPITFAGDLIDRGKDSRKVIEFVKNGGYDCVVGNHEVMMMDELKFKKLPNGQEVPAVDYYHGIWIMNGGDACLDSYMIEVEEELASGEKIKTRVCDVAALKEDLKWLKSLPYHIEYKNIKNKNGDHLLVTHTCADRVWDKASTDSQEFKSAVTWDRDERPQPIPGIFSVYGHTPQKNVATVGPHWACIDTGAYFKRAPYGRMTAFQFPQEILYEQGNVE